MPPVRPKLARITPNAGVSVALVLGTGILLASVQRHYPIQHWVFWRYATYWIAALALCFSCAAGGHAILRAIFRRPLPWLEQLALAQALGIFAFQLALFVLGILRLYGAFTFYALPLAFLALGGRPFFRSLRRGIAHLRAPQHARHLSAVAWLAIFFGFASLIALYLPVMASQNASFDARWRHLYIAEQYAHFGGIRRFDEGWSLGASPHFTSLLYAWGFMHGRGLLFDRIEFCAHIEYVIFLSTTLIGIPALVRRLVPHANPATVWAARFLFPGTFLYDSNLSVGADHIGAVFAPAIAIAGMRYWRERTVREGLVLGALIAAAICAKETTALLIAPFFIVLVATRFAIDAVRTIRGAGDRGRLIAGLVAGAATFVLTMPHWLKNLVWYGDPLYPNLHAHFSDRPWGPHAAYAFEYGFKTMLWAPTKDFAGLREAVSAVFTFAFKPHGWWSMHRDVPVLGSLFTLFLIALPFVRGARRIWYVVACVQFSVFAWFWVHHEDRHLQALVPWMAAQVAATATLIWRSGGAITRTCLALLLGAQAVWGADVYFYPTHSMTGAAALKAPTEFLGQGYLGNYERRFDVQTDQVTIGKRVPKDAVLLVHERRDHLGYGHRTITDVQGDQYGIDWLDLGSPDRIYAKLRSFYVSHAVWPDGHSEGIQTLGGDVAFFEFVHRYTKNRMRVGGYNVAELPKTAPPPPNGPRWVAVLGCPGVDYETGLYYLSDLSTPRFGPDKYRFPLPRAPLTDAEQWRKQVIAIVIDNQCPQPGAPRHSERDFERIARRGDRWGRSSEILLKR
jgi:dolichyl-phosphate-mannose-protein mannosyltransferase